ncbi:DNA packaging protein [Haloimpatiens massiliensis]|uniref:DNA packaging protein n=1 Tax=Haloimpatiens massiliensis TaxID=1658110 RepID=UPI000C82B929|nr:DNA packaging protein [Haloimpatiens massiliensis]
MANKLTEQEQLKIVMNDSRIFAKNMTKILNVENKKVEFVLNNEQNTMSEVLKDNKYVCCLKARQLGISEFCINYIIRNMMITPDITCLIASYDDRSVRAVVNKFKRQYKSIPRKYKLGVERDNDNEFKLSNGARCVFSVAGNNDLLRGDTAQIIMLTEFGVWKADKQEDTLTSLEPLLSKNDKSRIIIESTAKQGTGDYFYKICMGANKGDSKYKLVFFPWYENKTLYASEYDMAEQWYKNDNHGHRLQEKDLTPYELDLYKKGATLKQLMWRRWKLLDMKLNKFYNEHPSTPQEAFAGNSTDNVFDQEIILERVNYIDSNDIKPLTFKEVNENKPLPSILSRYYGKGFNIYKTIKSNGIYWGGIDTSMGIGGNRDGQTVQILDSNGEQVAAFNRNDVPIYKFADIVYEIGMYFNYMMLNIEVNVNGGTGADLLVRLKEKGYIQILKSKRFNKVTGKVKLSHGWVSMEGTKSKLISDLKEYFETGMICISDKDTLNQMNTYIEKNGKMGNQRGNDMHDDLVIALGLAVMNLILSKSYL